VIVILIILKILTSSYNKKVTMDESSHQ